MTAAVRIVAVWPILAVASPAFTNAALGLRVGARTAVLGGQDAREDGHDAG